jgi:hypothetical protein
LPKSVATIKEGVKLGHWPNKEEEKNYDYINEKYIFSLLPDNEVKAFLKLGNILILSNQKIYQIKCSLLHKS